VDLRILISRLGLRPDPNLLVGIETMDDAGVYRLTPELALVETVDLLTPPVDDPFLFGQIAAANSLSDVYAKGGRPVTAMNICCFPLGGISGASVEQVLKGGVDKIQEAGATLVGGHTIRDEEMKYGLAVTGVVHPDRVVRNSTARPGDALILTKPVGTGVIINGTRAKAMGPEALEIASRAMAELNRTACEVMLRHAVSAGTDITGFGVAGHAGNIARASRVGLRLRLSRLPVHPDALPMIRKGIGTGITKSNREMTADLTRFAADVTEDERTLFFDPQTSGGLFFSLPADRADACLRELHASGVRAAAIVGEVFASGEPALEIVR
jgi:selenide,water dikinase